MFMNIDSSYKGLVCCFCLISTTVFQILWVPEITIPHNSVAELRERGISSACCDTARHRTPFLTHKPKFTSLVLMAAGWSPARLSTLWGTHELREPAALPASSAWHWKIPKLLLLLCWAGVSCEPFPAPGSPSAKPRTPKHLQLLKDFWELLADECSLSELRGSCTTSFHQLSVVESN